LVSATGSKIAIDDQVFADDVPAKPSDARDQQSARQRSPQVSPSGSAHISKSRCERQARHPVGLWLLACPLCQLAQLAADSRLTQPAQEALGFPCVLFRKLGGSNQQLDHIDFVTALLARAGDEIADHLGMRLQRLKFIAAIGIIFLGHHSAKLGNVGIINGH
jgi:hypothetical protein